MKKLIIISLIFGIFLSPFLINKTDAASYPKCAKYDAIITRAAQANGIRKSVLVAQLMQESGCNPKAVSRTGDYGICQINLRSFPKISKAQAFDAQFCIYFQAQRMGYLAKRYGEYNALRGYNCGEFGMARSRICGATYANQILKMAK